MVMKVSFREYVGLAGDLQAMLIATTDDGREERVLFNRSPFYEFNRWRAERKLIRRLNRQNKYKKA
jgi:hypothetical protein